MALANFFDKALLSAGQVLKGFEPTSFAERLGAHRVGIAYDAEASSLEGAAALDMTLRLVARFYPSIAIVRLGEGAPDRAAAVRLVRGINPAIEVSASIDGVIACLVIGNTPVEGTPAFYMGSNGWLALMSSSGPVGSGDSGNPFAAGAAACIAAANVFRLVFADQLDGAELDLDVRFSLLDWSVGEAAGYGPAWSPIDVGEAHLVGLGAIGNGAAWGLSRAAGLSGTLQLVDHENVDLTNLQRYVLMGQSDVAKLKVKQIARHFVGSELIVRPQPYRWGEYVGRRGDWRIDRVAVALDSARDRVGLQGALPKRIFNSWTQVGDLGVSRHLSFGGERPCLACLYHPAGQIPSEDELVAQAIGIPEEDRRMGLKEMLYQGQPVGPAFIMEVAARLGVPAEGLMAFAHLPLRSFYTDAICGGAVFRLSDGTVSRPAEVPLAFQSAMAGIMLAAELVIDCASLRAEPMPDRTVVNLLRRFPKYPSYPHPVRAGCICTDAVYVRTYREKYDPAVDA